MGHEYGAMKPRALTYAPVDNWISIASAAISVLGAIVAGVMTTWSNKNSRRFEAALQRQEHEQSKAEQAAQLLSRYREPLLLSANSLQSRIFNVLREDYLPIYLHCGDPEQELYARRFTVYTLAEYLCWVEIIRRELRFLDLGAEEENQEFTRRLLAVTNRLSNQTQAETHFRLFRGQQRALGELMMVPIHGTSHHDCLTYPEFSRRLDDDARFLGWFERLLRDVDGIADPEISNERLVRTQWALIDLIDFLDPARVRLGADYREKYQWTAPSPVPSTASSL
jgi:hypothetical protein